jgi:glycosyltransferase involved in cell wall biosynthesis
MTGVPFVAIGRNEGERLKRCLQSLRKVSDTVIYVDSGSTDGSKEYAESLGVVVVNLDISRGFTMARARNAGWTRLLEIAPDSEFVHFIDGDCELIGDWLPRALAFLGDHPEVAAVCGRRRERHPEASPYNLLCEIEWNTVPGEVHASGGDVLMRIPPLVSVGGFQDFLIAFEEPDLCRRLRSKGWKIWRLNVDMTRHDANILHFRQWWKRHERAGYGALVITSICRQEGDVAAAELFGKQVKSARYWVFMVLAMLLLGVPLASSFSGRVGASAVLGVVAALIGVQSLRIAWVSRKCSPDFGATLLYGLFTMIAKVPQALGQWQYARDRSKNRKAVIIEYK